MKIKINNINNIIYDVNNNINDIKKYILYKVILFNFQLLIFSLN